MRYSIIFLLLILHFTTFSQSYLRVADPNDWATTSTTDDPNWHHYIPEGQFDDISLVIRPQGIYTQVEFFTTISQGNGYSWWNENMEIIWQFRLPQQAIVHDSWLWVGEDIIKADVVDFWTASQIYEEIVDRNQDPSLLYQLPNGGYEIRIFPLPEGQSRRIKMSFLLPNSWSESKITTEILLPMLQSTPLYPEEVEIIIPQNNTWQNPVLQIGTTATDTLQFTSQSSPVYGPVHYLNFPGIELVALEQFNLKTDAPWSGNTWLQTYEEGGDKFYQLAIKPDWSEYYEPDTTMTDTTNRVLVLIDRESSKTSISKVELTLDIHPYLLDMQDEITSFGLMAAVNDSIKFYNDGWSPNNQTNLSTTFTSYMQDTDESDLEALLTEAINFINAGNPVEKILLFSANDAFVHPLIAEDFLSNIIPLLPTETPIDIYDFQDLNISTIYDDDQEYIANHQIFHILSQETGGILYEMRNSNLSLNEALNAEPSVEIEAPIGLIDLSVDMAEGICFQEQNLFSSFLYEGESPTLYQTGRYLGELPFEIEAAIILEDGSYYDYETTIASETISQGDTLMREIWYGNYLREESLVVSDEEELLQLIQQSINERVLIPQTAFLALEPEQGGTVCIPCLDSAGGGIIINTTDDEDNQGKMEVTISPNPANIQTKISLENIQNPNLATVEIFSAKGQSIQILTDLEVIDDTATWTWNIDDDIPSGMYICRITLADTILTQKIMVLKE